MGVDLTAIPTMGIDTALVLASEIGPDLSRFPSASHFVLLAEPGATDAHLWWKTVAGASTTRV